MPSREPNGARRFAVGTIEIAYPLVPLLREGLAQNMAHAADDLPGRPDTTRVRLALELLELIDAARPGSTLELALTSERGEQLDYTIRWLLLGVQDAIEGELAPLEAGEPAEVDALRRHVGTLEALQALRQSIPVTPAVQNAPRRQPGSPDDVA